MASLYLAATVCLTGTKAFGEKAITRLFEDCLPVDKGGLGDNVPRGELPVAILWVSSDASMLSSLCSVACSYTTLKAHRQG